MGLTIYTLAFCFETLQPAIDILFEAIFEVYFDMIVFSYFMNLTIIKIQFLWLSLSAVH